MQTVYRIKKAMDKEHNPKPLPEEWTESNYTLDLVTVGRSAFLDMVDNKNFLRTSTVEKIEIYDSAVTIITRNTIYVLEPVEVK